MIMRLELKHLMWGCVVVSVIAFAVAICVPLLGRANTPVFAATQKTAEAQVPVTLPAPEIQASPWVEIEAPNPKDPLSRVWIRNIKIDGRKAAMIMNMNGEVSLSYMTYY